MTIGEIKLESLRLMSANDEDLSVENLDIYKQDDRYKEYLDKMHGAINRAISRFMIYKVIPTKTAEVMPSQGETLKQYLKFNLNKIIPDFGNLERVIYISERVVPNVDFESVTDGVILIPFSSNYVFKGVADKFPETSQEGNAYNVNGVCKYWNGSEWEEVTEDEMFNIEYAPILKPITATTDNSETLNIPEALARIVPYFIKAELYEQDEPELSATARNIFESALTEYVSFGMARKQRQQYVKNTML